MPASHQRSPGARCHREGDCQVMLNIQENVSLAPKTTFEIGGAARYFVEAASEGDVKEALLWARSHGVPHVVLAGGSNVLVPDAGLDALVIHIASTKWNVNGTVLEADAGLSLVELIKKTNVLGIGGWEKLAGIPGTLGGAVRGNAGAFGCEVKDVLTSARALNVHTLATRELTNADCTFSYRNSFFKQHPDWIVLSARITLQKGNAKDLMQSALDTIAERERRHIQNVRAAGSYFMNPIAPQDVREMFEKEKGVSSREGRVPAGWLIEKVNLKGAREGGAEASMQHPNYLVNASHATAEDVRRLATRIKKAVREQFNIELNEEAVVF